MAHIKRAKVAEEAKREAENPMKGKYFDQPFPNVNAIRRNTLPISDLYLSWR